MERITIVLLLGLIVIAIAALIGAWILQLAMQMAVGVKPKYGNAYLTTIVVYFIVLLIDVGLRYITGNPISFDGEQSLNPSDGLVLNIFAFFVQSGVYSVMLKYPDSGAIGFGKALLVSLIQIVLSIVIGIAIALLILILIFIALLIFGGG